MQDFNQGTNIEVGPKDHFEKGSEKNLYIVSWLGKSEDVYELDTVRGGIG